MRFGISDNDEGVLMEAVATFIGFTVVVATVAVAAIVKMGMDQDSAAKAKLEAKPAPVTRKVVFIGPPLDPDARIAECMLAAAAKPQYKDLGLEWQGGEKGWRAPTQQPEPQLANNPIVDDRWVADWTRRMQAHVGRLRSAFDDCKNVRGTPGQDARPVGPLTGLYVFDFQRGSNCGGFPPPTMKIKVTEKPFSLTFPVEGKQLQIPGQMDNHVFRAVLEIREQTKLFPGQIGDTLVQGKMEFRGRFDTFNSRWIIREGVGELQLKLDADGETCRLSFSAIREEGQG